MEITTINNDIKVFYLIAKSFPESVPKTYEMLHSLVSDSNDRKYFGISHPDEKGNIVYKAGTEELETGEAEKYNCETFTIKKGKYISIYIKDHMKDPSSIVEAFKKLLSNPDIDPKGYCLEWYINYNDPDVNCMVGLK
jgi:hypothetical protein